MIQRLIKNTNPVLLTLLVIIFVILSCCLLPSQILYWTLCTDQDRNIPANTEVLVSSCKRPTVIGVPGGEVLFVHEGRTNKMYLLDLRTGEKRKVPNYSLLEKKGRKVFLDANLVWVGPNNILDLTDGQSYELFDLMSLPRLEDNNFNPDNYSYIQPAERVFIDPANKRLIALSTDFRTNQNGRVTFSGYISDDDEFLFKLVKSLGMDYENVDLSLRNDSSALSPTGKYVVRKDGVYLSETNKKLATPYMSYYFKSWYYDESGVVVHDEFGTYWLQYRYLGEYGLDIYHLSRPVLKLRLPEP